MIGQKTKVVFSLWLDANLTIGDESPVARSTARRHKQDCLNFLESQPQYMAVFGSELSSHEMGLVGVRDKMEDSGRELEKDEIGRIYFEVARAFVSWMNCALSGVLGHEVVGDGRGVDDAWFDEICAWLSRFGCGSFRLVVRSPENEEVLVVPIPRDSSHWHQVRNWVDERGGCVGDEIGVDRGWLDDLIRGRWRQEPEVADKTYGSRNDAIKSVYDHMEHYGYTLYSLSVRCE